jgi:NDP-sugar pyrophosphorylase family protein
MPRKCVIVSVCVLERVRVREGERVRDSVCVNECHTCEHARMSMCIETIDAYRLPRFPVVQ